MEARLYFSAFVCTICAVHLIWNASAWLESWWKKNVLFKKQLTAAHDKSGKLAKAPAPQRSDWYAFFHCSDLVGRDPVISKTLSIKQNKDVQNRKNRQLWRATA